MQNIKEENYSFGERALELVSKMTTEEKISQLCVAPTAVPRLGIPKYHYINEASHGIFLLNCVNGNKYDVTSYPVCLTMSQSWDNEKVEKVAAAISDEARAFANKKGETLHFFAPTINLGRDPRNGRGDENFGEDPVLAGKMAAAYIQGFQGNDKKYLKTVSTPKHFMMNSSEDNRHFGSSNADEATMREYYGKVFEYAVKEGKAESIMTSYNRINGIPASANKFILQTLLREEWGFDGFVISDAGAVDDVYKNPMFAPEKHNSAHYYGQNGCEAASLSLMAGTDVSLGTEFCRYLKAALDQKLISEDMIDRAVYRSLLSRFKLGLFDDAQKVPYTHIGMDKVCSSENQKLCVDIANDSIVLLKNEKRLLPLKEGKVKKVLIVGPNAKYRQLGGYGCGSTNRLIDTPVNIMLLDGIKDVLQGYDTDVLYEKGWCTGAENIDTDIALPGIDLAGGWFDYMGFNIDKNDIEKMGNAEDRHFLEDPDQGKDNDALFSRALMAAKEADVVIMMVGTDSSSAAEEHDRENLALPYDQNTKIKQMLKENSNTIIVMTTPGMVTGDFFDDSHTLVYAGFAGEAQGTALANILFGRVNPNAKLTTTWYKSEEDLPHINDYGIKKQDTIDYKARTYMYFEEEVRFPFGFGLSYTEYKYSNIRIAETCLDANAELDVSVDVTNIGSVRGKEIVQLYIKKVDETQYGNGKPFRQLKAFTKIELDVGETKTVRMKLPLCEITFWNNFRQKMMVEEGNYIVEIGGSSADIACFCKFQIVGTWVPRLESVAADISKYIYEINETGRVGVSATLQDTRHLKENEYTLSYKTSDPNVIKIDETGSVQAIGKGIVELEIIVTYRGEVKSTKIPVVVK